jgi:hypothetical protein
MMDTSTTHTTAPSDATEFKAVEGTGEQFNGYTLLVEAYAAIWIILMGWLLLVWRRQVKLTTRIAGLEDAIARAAKGASPEKPS